jgi:hypothetical protein
LLTQLRSVANANTNSGQVPITPELHLNNCGMRIVERAVKRLASGFDEEGYARDWMLQVAADADCAPRAIADAANTLVLGLGAILQDPDNTPAAALNGSGFAALPIGARQAVYAEIGRQFLGAMVYAYRDRTIIGEPVDYQADLDRLAEAANAIAALMDARL